MGLVTILWSGAAGVSVTLAVTSGAVGLTARENSSSLTVFVLGLATAACAYLELCMMHSTTPAEFGEWLLWYHIPVCISLVGQALFVRFYLGTGRWWLLCTVNVARIVILVVNFLVVPNFNFVDISRLDHPSFLGESIAIIGSATPRLGWQLFATASTVLLVTYSVDAAVTRWRMGDPESRRRALAIGLGIAAPWFFTMGYAQLIVLGFVRGPVTSLLWLLGTLFVMMFELTRDYVQSRHALAQLTEVQRELMQVERVSVLNQLATGLAHQLAQPLSASTINSAVALKHLDKADLDRGELREILIDINKDSRRGAELIDRMRRLAKNHAIELQPVKIDDVVQDAVSLIGPEASTMGVALSWLVEPDLPCVAGDRVHLSQVLINLLINGIQAVQVRPPEGRRVVIEARADVERRQVAVMVRDSGPGIPEGAVDKVFEPFFTTKPDGMGMGLALARTIIEAHGGRLWMDRTTPQDGAVFRFTLQKA